MPLTPVLARAPTGRLQRYAFAGAVVGLAAILSVVAHPLTGGRVPFLWFLPAIGLASVMSGLGPAVLLLLATVVGALVFGKAPGGGPFVQSATDAGAVAIYAMVGGLIAWAADRWRAAHEAMTDAQRRLRDAQDIVGVGLWEYEPATGTTIASPGVWRLLGRERDAAAMTGEDWHRAIHPDDLPAVLAEQRGYLASGVDRYEQQYRVRLPSGDVRWIHSRVHVEHGRRGLVLRGASLDVTAQKAAEARAAHQRGLLELWQDRYRSLVEATAQIVVTYDARGRPSERSPSWERYTGQDERALLDGRGLAAVHPADATALRVTWARIRTADPPTPYSQEFRVRRRDGEWRWMRAGFVPVLGDDGALREWVGAFEDVHDFRLAEAERRRAEERFRVAQDSSAVAFTVLRAVRDATGRILDFEWTYANAAAARILGRPVAELVGRRLLALLPGNRMNSELYERYVRVVETGEPHDLELHYAADGIHGWFRNLASRLEDGVAIWFMDVTAPKELELALSRRSSELQASVAELTRAEEELRDADRRKDEFLATLAHELRNPLAPIRTGLAVLARAGFPDPALESTHRMMQRQVDQLVRLIDDLMDVNRISRGKLELRRERLAVAAIVEAALETCRPGLEAARHRVAVDAGAEPLEVDGDRARLVQVLCNLLSNATRYSPEGSDVRIAVRRDGDAVAIAVTDRGFGIAREALERIFEMFAQVPGRDAHSNEGLGIGLALSRQLVAMHGGTLVAASDGPGTGSTFTLQLPLAMAAPAAAAAGADAARTVRDGGGRGLRVLIADDNADSAESMALFVRMLGHATAVAGDGLEALELGARLEPDVVLLDIGMPALDGLAAARRIRAEAWGRAVVLCAMTGWGQPTDRQRTAEAGFDRHFVKPVDLDALERLLADVAAAAAGTGGRRAAGA